MSVIADILSWALILLGALGVLSAAVGLLRLPDFYTRTHTVGVLDTLGAGMILVGVGLQSGFSLLSIKLALILAFIWLTGTTAAHALARTAEQTGMRPHATDKRETQSSTR